MPVENGLTRHSHTTWGEKKVGEGGVEPRRERASKQASTASENAGQGKGE